MSDGPWSERRLYGQPGDEILFAGLDDAVEHYVDDMYDQSLPFDVVVSEFSVYPRGDFGDCRLPDGKTLAEDVLYRLEDVYFEELHLELKRSLESPDVVKLLDEAMDLVRSKQQFMISDRQLATHRVRVTGFDDAGCWRYEVLDG